MNMAKKSVSLGTFSEDKKMKTYSEVTSIEVPYPFFLAAPRCLNSSHPQLCQEPGELADQCHDEHPRGNGPHQGTIPFTSLELVEQHVFLSHGANCFVGLFEDLLLQNQL